MNRKCGICQQPFYAIKRSNKYCSEPCREEAKNAYYRDRNMQKLREKLKGHICIGCGEQLNDPRRRYCNNQCKADSRARMEATELDVSVAYKRDSSLAAWMAWRGYPEARKAVAA